MGLIDATDNFAVRQHVEIIVPLPGWPTKRRPLRRQRPSTNRRPGLTSPQSVTKRSRPSADVQSKIGEEFDNNAGRFEGDARQAVEEFLRQEHEANRLPT
jgi:hypothetical protein